MVYINDLIVKIEQSSLHDTGILNIPSNCPSLADDLSCIGLTPLSLQNMLNIALVYSRKWRFKFNAQKSCILKFRAKGNRADQDYEWTLGEDVVPCLDVCNHLGILINNKCTLTDRIAAACRKGRNSYFALADIGSQYLNPLTVSHLYKRVVLSSVLYGCELWNNISSKDSQRLNVFQHFVCKNAQNLPKGTRSDIFAKPYLILFPFSQGLMLGSCCSLDDCVD